MAVSFAPTYTRRLKVSGGRLMVVVEGTVTVTVSAAATADLPASLFGLQEISSASNAINADDDDMTQISPSADRTALVPFNIGAEDYELPVGVHTVTVIGR